MKILFPSWHFSGDRESVRCMILQVCCTLQSAGRVQITGRAGAGTGTNILLDSTLRGVINLYFTGSQAVEKTEKKIGSGLSKHLLYHIYLGLLTLTYVIFLRQIKVFVFGVYFRIVYPEAHLCLKLSGEVKLAQIFI